MAEIDAAQRLYEIWSKKKSRRTQTVRFGWPSPMALFGLATKITYRSDKWNPDGQEEKYIHAFKHPYTRILVNPPNSRSKEGMRLRHSPIFGDLAPPAKDAAFAWLGHCMHLEYREDTEASIRFWQFLPYDQPMLAVDANHPNLLLLVWENEPCWIVTSPILRVTARGILF